MKTEKKEDRRIRKTKQALQKGLAELLTEKQIQKITIKELTERVDVHRGTFYVHYEDIYDLYHSIETRVISEIEDLLSKDYPFGYKGLTLFYELLFSYLLEHKEICRSLFEGHVNYTFIQTLKKLFLNACLDDWHEEYGIDKQSEEIKNYASFYLAGSFFIISEWVENNFNYPVEKLILMLSEIDISFGKMFK